MEKELLKNLDAFVTEMKGTSKVLAKKAIIEKYKDSQFILDMVEATYNPFKVYHVTSKQLKKHPELCHGNYLGDLKMLLHNLEQRIWTGHEAIAYTNGFVSNHPEYAHIIHSILDRNLEVRASDSVFNSVIPDLIPTFKPALANVYNPKLVDLTNNERWYASRKLDGVRCLARVDTEGECTLYSRTGKEFTTLNKVKEAVEATGLTNVTFDGEICLMDADGNEDFQSVMKQLRRKDHQIENPEFMMFDMIHKLDFEAGKQRFDGVLSDRLRKLRSFMNNNGYYDPALCDLVRPYLRYLDQYQISDNDHFNSWSEMPKQEGWEGLMLRKDVAYEGKRTKNLLKVKMFHDAEYEVVDCDFAPMSVVRDGKEAQETMLAQVYIEHKGYRVKVGSGFSQEQRIKYITERIIGKTITVQYFEETKNDKGGISLRFPTVKHIYENERDC